MSLSPESGYLPISRDKQYCLCWDSASQCSVVTHCKRCGVPAFTSVCQALRCVSTLWESHSVPTQPVHAHPCFSVSPQKGSIPLEEG